MHAIIAPKCFCIQHRGSPGFPCSACYIQCIKISSWLTACLNRNLPEASSGQHRSHLSSARTRLLTHALGSNLSHVVRDCLSLGLCPLSHYTLCSSLLQWFVLLWHSSTYMNMYHLLELYSINAYKEYTFHDMGVSQTTSIFSVYQLFNNFTH